MSRVLTGDRPTGALHLGHYFGTLSNRVRLQRAGHEVFVVVADYQVVTDRDRPGDLRTTTAALVRDYLACGLDPDRTVIFPHSAVPALNQLLLPFLSLVGMGELMRNPTVKDEIRLAGRDVSDARGANHGHRASPPARFPAGVSGLMFTYPVHQAADILFCKGELVPVGRDQLPHLELTRSIARRFAERYGPVFPLPEPMLGDAPVLLGLDGRKMSKSLGNAIALADPPDVVAAKVRAARTDSERAITFEPQRRPEVATLLTIAALCTDRTPESVAHEIGGAGAAALKALVVDAVNTALAPIHDRRAGITDEQVRDVLVRGTCTANTIANDTLAEVREVMGMDAVPL